LLLVALSLIFEFFVPTGDRVIAVAAELSGLATWIVPALLLALSWNQKPRTSLAGVGFAISLFVVAASFSAISLWLALLTLVFAQDASRAWLALMIIAAFWVSLAALLVAGDQFRRRKERSK
jgi:apolipoprotein N-acyltransferase